MNPYTRLKMSSSKLAFAFLMCHFVSSVVLAVDVTKLHGNVSVDPSDIKAASINFGGLTHIQPSAVLYPNSADDIVHLVKMAYREGFKVSARGNGHSCYGQSLVADGVVIHMSGSKAKLTRSEPVQGPLGPYVDVWGGDLWIDVLNWSLKYGLTPKSWTNYLDLTVGGTLSNAGVAGQTYVHGPQTSNVYELDVVTGKGELITCSEKENSDLFFGVLGGLGQFGIITRARIALEEAPESLFQIEAIYHDFNIFTKDMEYLASLYKESNRFDSMISFVIIREGVVSFKLELLKYFSKSNKDDVVKDIDVLLAKLHYDPSSITNIEFPYVGHLDRLREVVDAEWQEGSWLPHPWMDLFVAKSGLSAFNEGIINGILGNDTNGRLIMFPMNRDKWDSRTSVVTPEPNDDIFYSIFLLRRFYDRGFGVQDSTDFIVKQNKEVLDFCKKSGIDVKWYIPHYETREDWVDHFGDKWDSFSKKKIKYDPKHILATGQMIFNSHTSEERKTEL